MLDMSPSPALQRFAHARPGDVSDRTIDAYVAAYRRDRSLFRESHPRSLGRLACEYADAGDLLSPVKAAAWMVDVARRDLGDGDLQFREDAVERMLAYVMARVVGIARSTG